MDIKLTTISDVRRMSGFDLFQMLDAIGLKPDVVAWVHDADSDHWWYLIATPLIDSHGPKWIYDRLMSALRVLKIPPEISPLDIRMYSPNEMHIAQLIRRMPFAGTNDRNHVIMSHIDGVDFGDFILDAIVAYRIGRQLEFAATRARQFSRRVEKLLKAA